MRTRAHLAAAPSIYCGTLRQIDTTITTTAIHVLPILPSTPDADSMPDECWANAGPAFSRHWVIVAVVCHVNCHLSEIRSGPGQNNIQKLSLKLGRMRSAWIAYNWPASLVCIYHPVVAFVQDYKCTPIIQNQFPIHAVEWCQIRRMM